MQRIQLLCPSVILRMAVWVVDDGLVGQCPGSDGLSNAGWPCYEGGCVDVDGVYQADINY